MDPDQLVAIFKPVDAGDKIRIVFLFSYLGAVVVDAFLGPRVEIQGLEVEDAARQLDIVGRTEVGNQGLELLDHVIKRNIVGLIMDQH